MQRGKKTKKNMLIWNIKHCKIVFYIFHLHFARLIFWGGSYVAYTCKHRYRCIYYKFCYSTSTITVGMFKKDYSQCQQFQKFISIHPPTADSLAGVLLQQAPVQLPPGRRRLPYQRSAHFQFYHFEPWEITAWFSLFTFSLNPINYNYTWVQTASS